MEYYGKLIRRSWGLLVGYPGLVALGLRIALARNIASGLNLAGYAAIAGLIAILVLYLLYARAIASLMAGVARIEEDREPMSLRMMWEMGEVWTWAVLRVIAAVWLIPSLVITIFTIVTHRTLFGTGGLNDVIHMLAIVVAGAGSIVMILIIEAVVLDNHGFIRAMVVA